MGLAERRFKSTLDEGPTPEEYLSVVSDVCIIPTPANSIRAIAVEYAGMKFRAMMQGTGLENLRATLHDVIQLFVNAPLRGRCISCDPNQNAEALLARCFNCGKGGISFTS